MVDKRVGIFTFRRLTWNEIKQLKAGDKVAICTYMDSSSRGSFVSATVVGPLFWNYDADEPDWELETTNGFVDIHSVYEIVYI